MNPTRTNPAEVAAGDLSDSNSASLSAPTDTARAVPLHVSVRGAAGVSAGLAPNPLTETIGPASLTELNNLRAAIDEHAIVAVTDAQARITHANDKFCAISQYSREELLGQDHRIVSSGHHPKEYIRELWATVGRGRVWHGDFKNRAKDGSYYWVNCTIVPFLGGDGRPSQYVSVCTDITARMDLERQLLQAQRVEAIGTLANGVAHDLNNILAPVLMAAALLKSKITDQRDREILTMVEQSAQRGAKIIEQLLTFSRGIEGTRGVIQLRHLIKEMINIMRETFPRNIEIEQEVPNDLWTVSADATQLHQVLLNLCVNARDAMPGGGKLRVEARNVRLEQAEAARCSLSAAGLYLMLSVKDTGAGITPANLPRIFDPFFTTKAVGKGTGLGLSTVIAVVRNHKGGVTVDSECGRGTVFNVYLPATGDTAEPTTTGSASPLPVGHGEVVLFVDDEASLRETTERLLRDNGYRVLTAGSGGEALKLYIQHSSSVRLVMTDVMMPGMGGLELAHSLRILDPALKIIATSGLGQENHQKDFARLGVGEMLTKPCEPAVLLRALERALASAP